MNETQTIVKPKKSFIARLALILACLALGLSAWQFYTTQQSLVDTRQELAQRLSDERGSAKTLRAMIEQTVNATHTAQGRVAILETRVNESAGQYATLNNMYQELTKSRTDWLLTEIEYTLAIANQQLQLAGNITAAISALEQAESRLGHYDRPELVGLKIALARDLETLKSLPYLDTADLSGKLGQLITLADNLPLIGDSNTAELNNRLNTAETPQENRSIWSRFITSLKQSLGELIQIRRVDTPDIALLSSQQTLFLKENIKLRLLNARIALLQRDDKTYLIDLATADRYVRRYFDMNAPISQQWLATLKDLQDAPIYTSLPDTLNSLKAVRDIQGGKP